MRHALTYSARLLALILATVSGVSFAFCCAVLIRLYFEMPGVIMRDDLIQAAVVGLGFVCFTSLYVFLARRTSAQRPRRLTRQ